MKRSYFVVLLVLVLGTIACTISSGGGAAPPPVTPTPTPMPVIVPTITATPTSAGEEPSTGEPPAESPAATDTSVPPADDPPPVSDILYGVTFVEEGDTLNVRSGPGVGNEVVATFPPIFAAIEITGPGQEVDGGLWVPVRRLETEGWVNRFFLTEVVSSEDFCANPATQSIVSEVQAAVASSDSARLAALVHPTRGLWLRMNWWNEEVGLSSAEVNNFFTDPTVHDWGIQDGSGAPITGSVAEVAVPPLQADLNAAGAQIACNEILQGGTAGLVVTPPKYMGINYYSVHRPPATEDDFDWGTWVIGIEYYNGTPFLTYLVHYEWEI